MSTSESPPPGDSSRRLDVAAPPSLNFDLVERHCPESPLRLATPRVATITPAQLDEFHLSADEFEDPHQVDSDSVLDGYTAATIFSAPGAKGYTFDDLIVLPSHINFGVDDVDLSTPVTRRIRLSSPIVSSPMDTVTEESMATAMALQGGLGVIHCQCSVEDQVAMVRSVKSFTNGFIGKPACMRPDQPIADLDALVSARGISGVPVTADGTIGSRLLGLVEGKDVDFAEDRSAPLSSVMQPLESVTTVPSPCTLAEANVALKRAKANYLCVVDEVSGKGNLVALTTRKDLIKNRDYPNALSSGLAQGNGSFSLVVGAAIQLPVPTSSTHLPSFPSLGDLSKLADTSEEATGNPVVASGDDLESCVSGGGRGRSGSVSGGSSSSVSSGGGGNGSGPVSPRQAAQAKAVQEKQSAEAVREYRTRALALAEAGCDVVVVDSRHGDTAAQVECVAWLKQHLPSSCEVIGGNVATLLQAKHLLDAGVDGLRVGMGTGSIATSQEVKACGRAQLSAIYVASRLARKYGVPVIADGGIRNTGCAIKALAMGASCVMMGSMLAGTHESPGEYQFEDGMRIKKYQGLTSHTSKTALSVALANSSPVGGAGAGSKAASGGSATAPYMVSGVAGTVSDNGSVHEYVPYLNQSMKHGLQDMGVASLASLAPRLEAGTLRFEMRSPSAQKEGGVHDLHSFTTTLFKSAAGT